MPLDPSPLLRDGKMERKSAMAYPSSACASASQGSASLGGTQVHLQPAARTVLPSSHPVEQGDHQLEKLEFALAVALTRGDLRRSEQLRHQIDALGGNREEPGT